MNTQQIVDAVDELSGGLVDIDLEDMRGLADLHTQFETMQTAFTEQREAPLVDAVSTGKGIIERIILGEDNDPGESVSTLCQIAQCLASVVRDGVPSDEVVFPSDLASNEDAIKMDREDNQGRALPMTLPSNVDETIMSEFLSRQPETLTKMEKNILDLEGEASEQALVSLRGLLHNLKGEAGMLGLTEVERLCHELEDRLEGGCGKDEVDGLLSAKDWLGQVFSHYAGDAFPPISLERFLSSLDENSVSSAGDENAKTDEAAVPGKVSAREMSFLESDPSLVNDFIVEAREHLASADTSLLTLESDPKNQEAIDSVFRAFHTIKGVAGFVGLPDIQALAHEAENLFDKVRTHEMVLENESMDVSFDCVDGLKRMIDDTEESLTTGEALQQDENMGALIRRLRAAILGQDQQEATPESDKPIGKILVEKGTATSEAVDKAVTQQQSQSEQSREKIGEILVKSGEVKAKDVAEALRTQRKINHKVKEPVKVDSDRLDYLVDAIGEMVIAESMVSQAPGLRKIVSPEVARHLTRLDKITHELQGIATSLRMVPVKSTFQKMARLVRDLAKKSGKSVEFVMHGEDTELDKTVVDKIGDPLVHMVRNAVDHGLEASAQDRLRANKPERGRVELRAFHQGGSILIEIQDDGRGLDRSRIVKKAIERGLIQNDEGMSDGDVWKLIFEAGFSTAECVTEVSGRGVGMDVVRRNITALRGHVDIRSTLGEGTTFSMRLPLTLAIIDGMVVRIGEERYIVPTLSVVESVRPCREDLSTVVGANELMMLHGQLIPLFRLSRVFNTPDAQEDATRAIVVVVEHAGARAGMLVDELLGQQQIVIKPLGESLGGVAGISGAAIMPDGNVGLILDVGGLAAFVNSQEESRGGNGSVATSKLPALVAQAS